MHIQIYTYMDVIVNPYFVECISVTMIPEVEANASAANPEVEGLGDGQGQGSQGSDPTTIVTSLSRLGRNSDSLDVVKNKNIRTVHVQVISSPHVHKYDI